MCSITSSYKHLDDAAEQNRLIQQFQREWPWEREALRELGIIPCITPVSTALSYGCGTGIEGAALLTERCATYVEGWDRDARMVKRATKSFGSDDLFFRRVDLTDGRSIPAGQKFDLIFCRLVFLHNKKEEVRRLMKSLTNLLNDGGLLAVHDVDKSKELVTPIDHEFSTIVKEIHDYLVRCGNYPQIGALMPQMFTEVGLRSIRCKVIEQVKTFEETKADLIYCLNVRDDMRAEGRLVSQELWDSACDNNVTHFERTTIRVISVGQKP